MKEEITKNKLDGAWVQDNLAPNCKTCNREFNLTRRRVSIFMLQTKAAPNRGYRSSSICKRLCYTY